MRDNLELRTEYIRACYDDLHLRRYMSSWVSCKMSQYGLTKYDLMELTQVKMSQIDRILDENLRGPLNLLSIIQIVNYLKLKVKIVINDADIE